VIFGTIGKGAVFCASGARKKEGEEQSQRTVPYGELPKAISSAELSKGDISWRIADKRFLQQNYP
jgi:hypothetical protein